MGLWILPTLGISLGLTIVIELLFALIIGIRNRKDLLLVVLVNILTNPPVVFIYYLLYFYTAWSGMLVKIPLEILAVLVEGYYYKSFGKEFRRPFLFSLFANTISFGIGILINIVVS